MGTLLYISLIAYLISFATCKVDYHAIQIELAKNIDLWESQEISSYNAIVERVCFCSKEFLGPFNIEVKDKKIVSCDSKDEICEILPTVKDLFDGIQKAIDEKYAGITVTYDEKLGYPTYFYYDISEMIADEELGIKYNIVDFETDDISLCHMPMEIGPCEAAILRYYYDKNTNVCKEFTYGGCGGNGNNFETIKECEAICKRKDETNICELPSETGPCKGYFERYYYNKETGECEQFIYGGCGGNGNNFETKDECEVACINGDYDNDDDEGCFCPAVFDPVCGINGETYGNSCEASCANVEVKCEGECPCKKDNEDDCDIVYCLVDPCQYATCPRFPDAKCVSNYCGGCFADFYIGDYKISDCGTADDNPYDFSCTKEGQMCGFGSNNDFIGSFDDYSKNEFDKLCCKDLTCCPKSCKYKNFANTCQKSCRC